MPFFRSAGEPRRTPRAENRDPGGGPHRPLRPHQAGPEDGWRHRRRGGGTSTRARREFARKQGIPRVVGSYAALVEDPDIDAIYNPLPNGLHGYWTIAALRAGKHVLCEKPFTANADEARAVAEAANGNPGVVVMEAFHYQYHPLTKRLVEIVRSGELGNITAVDVAFSAPLWKKGDIRYQLGLAGGATMDMGCYPVSLLRLLVPGPRVISAEAKLSSPGVDRAMDARFSLPDGGSAHIGCSMFSSSVLRLHADITGDNGKISIFNPFAPQHGHRMKVTTSLGHPQGTFQPQGELRLPARGVRGRH